MRPPPPPILEAFAQRYERSAGGRTGETQREFRVDIEDLLLDLRATEGDARAVAEQHLRDAAIHGLSWHFGDSDEAGFEILRVLREKTGRNFKPFLMYRGRDPREQEALGRPDMAEWPFYCRAVESGRFGPD